MADEKTQAAKTEDRRVRRTKKLLQQGLTELMERKPVKDITVRELADLTDLNRGTFYMHYRDVFDMLDQVNVPGTINEHPNWRRRLSVLLEDFAADSRLSAVADVLRHEGRAIGSGEG